MSSLYESLLANPEVECCHPKFIATVNGAKCVIADALDGEVYLTEAGRAFVASADDGKAKRASKKAAKEVQSTNTSADDLPDLDLGE